MWKDIDEDRVMKMEKKDRNAENCPPEVAPIAAEIVERRDADLDCP